jgi:hypothetical protein
MRDEALHAPERPVVRRPDRCFSPRIDHSDAPGRRRRDPTRLADARQSAIGRSANWHLADCDVVWWPTYTQSASGGSSPVPIGLCAVAVALLVRPARYAASGQPLDMKPRVRRHKYDWNVRRGPMDA